MENPEKRKIYNKRWEILIFHVPDIIGSQAVLGLVSIWVGTFYGAGMSMRIE